MKRIFVRFHSSKSPISLLIRFLTWSAYSHVDMVVGNQVYEAERWVGVRRYSLLTDNKRSRRPNTVKLIKHIDVSEVEFSMLQWYLNRQLGRRYDYLQILRFIYRKDESKWTRRRFFCSELVFSAFKYVNIYLLDIRESYKVTPGMLKLSTILQR